jgi:hypothetical protein
MMKKLILLIVTAFTSLFSAQAFAQSPASASVPVQIVLTPKCVITAPATVSLAYESFGAATPDAKTGQVKCTNSRPYRIAFSATDNTKLTDTGTGVGLPYTLTLSGTGAGSNGTGSGVDQGFTVTGVVDSAGLAGTCATGATCTYTGSHTMYVIY